VVTLLLGPPLFPHLIPLPPQPFWDHTCSKIHRTQKHNSCSNFGSKDFADFSVSGIVSITVLSNAPFLVKFEQEHSKEEEDEEGQGKEEEE
jgi:hypothetical protein